MSRIGDLWDELLRRRVVRVAVAYAAVVFVVIQAGDIVFPALGLPDWTMTLVVVLAGLGLPVVVALAWAFDVGPGGIRRADASPIGAASSAAAPRPIRGVRRLSIVGALAVLVGGGVGAAMLLGGDQPVGDASLVAIVPFRVSGDPSLEYLREGMVDLLAASLTGEVGPRAADPRAVLSAWRRFGGSDAVDPAPAELDRVVEAVGAGQLLLGSVVGTPGRLTVTARLVRGGDRVNETSVEGPADSLPALIDRLTARLLSLEAGLESNRLAGLTSTSLPAVRAYLRGQFAFRRSRFTDARLAFDEALQLDSTFALAALGMSLTSGWGGPPTPMLPRAAPLLRRYMERLSPADRTFAEALVGPGNAEPRSVVGRVAAWQEVVALLPDRPDAWFQYGDELAHRGPLADIPDSWNLAERAFDRALALDSSFTPALLHLMDGANTTGDSAEFRRLHAILARIDASAAVGEYQNWSRIVGSGDTTALAAIRSGMDTLPSGFLGSMIFDGLYGTSSMQDLERAVEELLRDRWPSNQRAGTTRSAYRTLLTLGRPVQAAEALARVHRDDPVEWSTEQIVMALYGDGDSTSAAAASRALRVMPETSLGFDATCALGQWAAWSGPGPDTDNALRRLESLPVTSELVRARIEACSLLVRSIGTSLADDRDAAALVQRLDSLARRGPGIGENFLRQINFSLARLHERLGDDPAALRAIRRHPQSVTWPYCIATRWFEEARLATRLGEREAAILAWSNFLRLREHPEPAMQPKTDFARAELARLTAEGTP